VICQHIKKDEHREITPLNGLDILDVGCGAGLLSESLVRLGARVRAIDASNNNILVAKEHASLDPLLTSSKLSYSPNTPEDLLQEGHLYDVVTSLEVVEHVIDPKAFVGSCVSLLKPGGTLILSTLNRTNKAYFLAILGAEYILRWVPKDTHQWEKFLTPEELSSFLGPEMKVREMKGISYDPLRNVWTLSDDLSVNYFLVAHKLDPI